MRIILTGLLAIGMSASVQAADFGGDCCADLEQRVAELEATTARKGNRKVSLTVSGQVNAGVLYFDPDIDGLDSDKWGITDNGTSSSRFAFHGQAKIDADRTAGFVLEVGVGGDSAIAGLFLSDQDALVLRRANWFLDSKTLGKLSIGKGYTATSGIGSISVANTGVVTETLSLQPVSGGVLFGIDLPFGSEDLSNRIRYDTPNIGGFMVSASAAGEDDYGVAVRFAGEGLGFQLAAGVGYDISDSIDLGTLSIPTGSTEVKTLTASGSLKHVETGLFVNAAYGKMDVASFDAKSWHVMGGVERKFWTLGKTTLYGEYAKLELSGASFEPTIWGLGVVQAIDSAATDVYVAYRSYDLDIDDGPSPHSVMAGARIKF